MSIIRDAATHSGAKVNDFGQLLVEATTSTEDRHININHQEVWTLPIDATDPVGAGDYFFYFKNTGSETYFITDIRISSTVAGHAHLKHVTGTPVYVGATTVVPVNRFLGSSKTPAATVNTDTDITGLSDEGTLFHMVMEANKEHHMRTSAGVMIPPGQAISISWGAATGILEGTVSIVALV